MVQIPKHTYYVFISRNMHMMEKTKCNDETNIGKLDMFVIRNSL